MPIQETTPEMSALLSSIDSLNTDFLERHSYSSTRGIGDYVVKAGAEAAADRAGAVVGLWLGKQAGSAVGVAAANPVVGVAGYLIGRKVGAFIGGFVASYAMYQCLELAKNEKNNQRKTRRTVPQNVDIPQYIINDKNDSIGYYHNIAMELLISKKNNYIDSGEMDFENMHSLEKNYLSTSMSEIEFANSIADIMEDELNMPQNNVAVFKELGNKVTNTINDISVNDVELYSKKLYGIINSSGLSAEEKSDINSTNSILINSALFWNRK